MSKAKIHILTRPLEGKGENLKYLGDAGKHWGLIIEFTDGSGFYLCELTSPADPEVTHKVAMQYGSQSSSGIAVRRLSKFYSLEACKENNAKANIRFYGTCHTELSTLNEFKDKINIGKPYHLTAANCQKFVKELIKLLEVEPYVDDCGEQSCLSTSGSDLLLWGSMAVGFAALVGVGVGVGAYAVKRQANSNKNKN